MADLTEEDKALVRQRFSVWRQNNPTADEATQAEAVRGFRKEVLSQRYYEGLPEVSGDIKKAAAHLPDTTQGWESIKGLDDKALQYTRAEAMRMLEESKKKVSDFVYENVPNPIVKVAKAPVSATRWLLDKFQGVDRVGLNALAAAQSSNVDFHPVEAFKGTGKPGSQEESKAAAWEGGKVPIAGPVGTALQLFQLGKSVSESMSLPEAERAKYVMENRSKGLADTIPSIERNLASSPFNLLTLGKSGTTRFVQQIIDVASRSGVKVTPQLIQAAKALYEMSANTPKFEIGLETLAKAHGLKPEAVAAVLMKGGDLAGVAPVKLGIAGHGIGVDDLANIASRATGLQVPTAPIARAGEASARLFSKAQGLDLGKHARIGVEGERARAIHSAQSKTVQAGSELIDELGPAAKKLSKEQQINAWQRGATTPEEVDYVQKADLVASRHMGDKAIAKISDPVEDMLPAIRGTAEAKETQAFKNWIYANFGRNPPKELLRRANNLFVGRDIGLLTKMINHAKEVNLFGRPGFNITNFVEDATKMMMEGVGASSLDKALLSVAGKPNISITTVGGKVYDASALASLRKQYGMMHAPSARADIPFGHVEMQNKVLRSSGRPGDLAEGILEVAKDVGTLGLRRPMKRWARAQDELLKTALFFDGLEKGLSPGASAFRVRKVLFDPNVKPAGKLANELADFGSRIPYLGFFARTMRTMPELVAKNPKVANLMAQAELMFPPENDPNRRAYEGGPVLGTGIKAEAGPVEGAELHTSPRGNPFESMSAPLNLIGNPTKEGLLGLMDPVSQGLSKEGDFDFGNVMMRMFVSDYIRQAVEAGSMMSGADRTPGNKYSDNTKPDAKLKLLSKFLTSSTGMGFDVADPTTGAFNSMKDLTKAMKDIEEFQIQKSRQKKMDIRKEIKARQKP